MLAINDETQRTMVYQSYTSEALRLICESVTHALGGKYLTKTYPEILGLVPEENEENPEEKANDIINKFMADLGGNI